jgi:hypothetical protein
VGRRPAPRPGARGGEVVPSPRQARASLIAAAAATAVVALTAAAVALRADDGVAAAAAAGLGLAGSALVAAGATARRPVLVAPGAGLVGGAYALVTVVDGGPLDLHAPLVGAALLLACELALWAHELRATSPDEPGAAPRRVGWLALLCVGAYLAGVAVLAAADLVRAEGLAIDGIGVLAAGAVVAAIVVLSRRRVPAD